MEPFEFVGDWSGQLLAAAIHAGHDLRPELEHLMVLDEAIRLREEDPYTDRIADAAPGRVAVHRSRFEVDLNRPRDEAVYRTPEDCWGLELWSTGALPDDMVPEMGGRAVLKPLQGSGGSGVFVLDHDEAPNLKQIFEAICRDGYVVAQEYLPAAKQGDVRMFCMNGEPLQVNGKYAVFGRRNTGKDPRSNMSAGAKAVRVRVTDQMLELANAVRPRLIADGLYLVGLDIVGDELMEVNVFSPGGLASATRLADEDFAEAIIADLERKVSMRADHPDLENRQLACL